MMGNPGEYFDLTFDLRLRIICVCYVVYFYSLLLLRGVVTNTYYNREIMAPKSDLWKYFLKLSKTEAKCKVCAKIIKTSGNTTNLKSHFSLHKIEESKNSSQSKVSRL